MKLAFAVVAVAAMVGSTWSVMVSHPETAASQSYPSGQSRIDLDFSAVSLTDGRTAYVSNGPGGAVQLMPDTSEPLIQFNRGSNSVSLDPTGATFGGTSFGDRRTPTISGVHATYPSFYPSTDLEVLSGLDGAQLLLHIRSVPAVAHGNVEYSFELDSSLFPIVAPGILVEVGQVASTTEAIQFVDITGKPVLVLTPSVAIVNTARPADEPAVPAGIAGPEDFLNPLVSTRTPLVMRIERDQTRLTLTIELPESVYRADGVLWPITIDPSITGPITGPAYFQGENIVMDSDLIITSGGSAVFQDCTITMNKATSPNYEVRVEQGGSLALMSSELKSSNAAIKYPFNVNGKLVASDSIIRHPSNGVYANGGSVTLSNVDILTTGGYGIYLNAATLALTDVDITSPLTSGVAAYFSNIEANDLQVTGAGAEGVYLKGSGGNITASNIAGSTMNGIKMMFATRVNVSETTVSGSHRNGFLVVSSSPSIESSDITGNLWSGVVLLDDHSAYVARSDIYANTFDGIEASLNSEADIVGNSIHGNGDYGIFVDHGNPRIVQNEIKGNEVGIYLIHANKPGQPTPGGSIEDTYPGWRATPPMGGEESRITPLVAGITIEVVGPADIYTDKGTVAQYSLKVTNQNPVPETVVLSIDDDQSGWAGLVPMVIPNLQPGAFTTATLSVSVPAVSPYCVDYDVKVWANGTIPPFNSVWTTTHVREPTTLTVTNVAGADGATVTLEARLMNGAVAMVGESVDFTRQGVHVGAAITDAQGYARLAHVVYYPGLSQEIGAQFLGSCWRRASSGTGTLTINDVDTELTPDQQTGYWNDVTQLTVRLSTVNGNAGIGNKIVTFTLNSQAMGTGVTDAQGWAHVTFTNTLNPGDYTFTASYSAETPIQAASLTGTFHSLHEVLVVLATGQSVSVGQDATYTATLQDDEGNPIPGKTIAFRRGTTSVGQQTTDSAGHVSQFDDAVSTLPGGDYAITAEFAGDSTYAFADKVVTLTLVRHPSALQFGPQEKRYTDTASIGAKLVDENGAPLSGRSVRFTVQGSSPVYGTTGSNGWAYGQWSSSYEPGVYPVTATFDGDGTYATSSAQSSIAVLREISAFTGTVDYHASMGAVVSVQVRLRDDDLTSMASRAVDLTLDGGDLASGTTDSSGYWTYNLFTGGLPPGRYVLAFSYEGDNHYEPATLHVRVVITATTDISGNVIQDNAKGIYATDSGTIATGNQFIGNARGVQVSSGEFSVFDSNFEGSTAYDAELLSGGSLYLTDSTFAHQKVLVNSGAGLLTVRWTVNVWIRDPITLMPIANAWLTVNDAGGVQRFHDKTDIFGQTPTILLKEFEQGPTAKTTFTPHKFIFDSFAAAGTYLTVDRRLGITLYYGLDQDFDLRPDAQEAASDILWIEAESHTLDPSLAVVDEMALGNRAAVRDPTAGAITNPSSFYTLTAGTWRLFLRASTQTGTGELKASVTDSSGTPLPEVTFVASPGYSWYATPSFVISSSSMVQLALTVPAGSASSGLRLDRIALARELNSGSARVHWPGQLTDPNAFDVDDDLSGDGFETRDGSFWYEAEWSVAPWSVQANADRLVQHTDASSGFTLIHSTTSTTIVQYDQTSVTDFGDYVAVIRAYNRGSGVSNLRVVYTYSPETPNWPQLSFTRDYQIPPGFSTVKSPFNYRIGGGITFTFKLIDIDDVSVNHDQPVVEVDKVGFVRVYKEPLQVGNFALPATQGVPVGRFTPVVAMLANDPEMYMYYVTTTGFLVKIAMSDVMSAGAITIRGSFSVGVPTTEPISFDLYNLPFIAVGGLVGGVANLKLVNRNTMALIVSMPLPSAANGLAYKDGAVFFSTTGGNVYSVDIKSDLTLSTRWAFNLQPTLGASHAGAAVHNQQVYFPFDGGIAVYSADPADAANPARWNLAIFPDPVTACPPGEPGLCVLPPTGQVTGGVFGTPVFDMGHVYFVVEGPHLNAERYILYHYTEAGGIVWARPLGWASVLAAHFSPRLIIKDNMLLAAGSTLDAVDKWSGARLWKHAFAGNLPVIGLWAPVVTDKMLLYPYADNLYAFDADGMRGEGGDAGAHFGTDVIAAPGYAYAEDELWQKPIGAGEFAQPLFGDFDNDGYFDSLLLHGGTLMVLKQLMVQYRSYTPWAQFGLDADRRTAADHQFMYYPTDPLDSDFDRDGVSDGQELANWAGYGVVEAEDATAWHAWNHAVAYPPPAPSNPPATGMQNFNFFHQFGVTLTTGPTLASTAVDYSKIQLPFTADYTGTYRLTAHSASADGGAPGTTVDLRGLNAYVQTDPGLAHPETGSVGYGGTDNTFASRPLTIPRLDYPITAAMEADAKEIVKRAMYVKVGYAAGGGSSIFYAVDAAFAPEIMRIYADPTSGSGFWIVAGLSMDFSVDLSGGFGYTIEIGLDLSRVPSSLTSSGNFPMAVKWVRVEDLDKLRVDMFGTNPHLADIDQDGLSDGVEIANGWFPLSNDADKDGLDDAQELAEGTDADDRDTDHDGLRDRVELGWGNSETSVSIYDTTPSRGSFMEAIAHSFKGDPFFTPYGDLYTLINNYDADTTNLPTFPDDPDSDDDGLPDGWRDGWIYDEANAAQTLKSYQRWGALLSNARPIRYNESLWHAGDVYDNFPQIWEGEDLDLNGGRPVGGTWGFYTSGIEANIAYSVSRVVEFARMGTAETSPRGSDTDNDKVPDGYEVWYATRNPIVRSGNQIKPDPTTFDSDADTDFDYDLEANEVPAIPNVGSGGSFTIASQTEMFAQGTSIVGNNTPLYIRRVSLDLTSAKELTSATLELWFSDGTCVAANPPNRLLAGATATAYVNNLGWTDFKFNSLIYLSWPANGNKCVYIALRSSGSTVTWSGSSTTVPTWSMPGYTGGWTSIAQKPGGSYKIYGDPASSVGDRASMLEEYIVGTNPKIANTDGLRPGAFSANTDKLKDGEELNGGTGPSKPGRVIYRTDAPDGALWVNGYTATSKLFYDIDPTSTDPANWKYFTTGVLVVDPLAPFGGAAGNVRLLFILEDGSRIVYNQAEEKVYIWFPGASFSQTKLRELAGIGSEEYYDGTAWVYSSGGAPADPWKDNHLIRDAGNALQDAFKQLFSSNPFNWDTDNDGVGDGQEQSPFEDKELATFGPKDYLNDARDPDSDGDGLTDGEESLRQCPSWNSLYFYTDGAPPCSSVNPDGDSTYPMLDADSDDDGIYDSKENQWSSDHDGDTRINLVDPDSDKDLLCDGWCTSAIITAFGLQTNRGEDIDGDGIQDSTETSPIAIDTDGDGLVDGPNLAGGLFGEYTTSRLLGGTGGSTQVTPSNPLLADTDGDGIADGVEIRGYQVKYYKGGGLGDEQTRLSQTDPTKPDTDNDGVPDVKEYAWTSGERGDTDGDQVSDGAENANHDDTRQATETDPLRQDTDGDLLMDGPDFTVGSTLYKGEDVNGNGVHQATEPDPLKDDTDGDGVSDNNERLLLFDLNTAWTMTHDSDGDLMPDVVDADSDNDGLRDGVENADHDGEYSSDVLTELNPTVGDTDGDGLLDGAEPTWQADSNLDDEINGRDTNSNGVGGNDLADTYVLFRTNAVAGAYASSSVWVAVDPTVNIFDTGVTPVLPDFTCANARFDYYGVASTLGGAAVVIDFGPAGLEDHQPLRTPEGYEVFYDGGSPHKVFLVGPQGVIWEFRLHTGPTCTNYDSDNKPSATYVKNQQETYEWRRALCPDQDFDGVSNSEELALGSDPLNVDSDSDGLKDGREILWDTDPVQDLGDNLRGYDRGDSDGNFNIVDPDSDNDGLLDGEEDLDGDGWSQGETDPDDWDTDGDGLSDGREQGRNGDLQPSTTTDPLDGDSDDDGLCDGACSMLVAGVTSLIGEDANTNGRYDSLLETDPNNPDSDGDGLWDGQERALVAGFVSASAWVRGTDLSLFRKDWDVSTRTSAISDDTDGDTIKDGKEDFNHNGRRECLYDIYSVDPSNPICARYTELDPGNMLSGGTIQGGTDSDGDGVPDSVEDGNHNGIRDAGEMHPLRRDTDYDGILDNLESGSLDHDNDGKPDRIDFDSDGDSLPDGFEAMGWTVTVFQGTDLAVHHTLPSCHDNSVHPACIHSDPFVKDTDGDGLDDAVENQLASNPNDQDTDRDSINDIDEYDTGEITIIEATRPWFTALSLTEGERCTVRGPIFGVCWMAMWDMTVSWTVQDNAGLESITVTAESQFNHLGAQLPIQLNGALSNSDSRAYTMSRASHWAFGAHFTLTIEDVNGHRMTRDVHSNSLIDAAVQWIQEQILALIRWIVQKVEETLGPYLEALYPVFQFFVGDVAAEVAHAVQLCGQQTGISLESARVQALESRDILRALWVLAEGIEAGIWIAETVASFGTTAIAMELMDEPIQFIIDEFVEWAIDEFLPELVDHIESTIEDKLEDAVKTHIGWPDIYAVVGAAVFGNLRLALSADFDIVGFETSMEEETSVGIWFMEADGAARSMLSWLLVMFDNAAARDAMGPSASAEQVKTARALMDVIAVAFAIAGYEQAQASPDWYENIGSMLREVMLTFVSAAESALPPVTLLAVSVWVQGNMLNNYIGSC